MQTWSEALFQPRQSHLDGGAHVGGVFVQQTDVGVGRPSQRLQVSGLFSEDDKNFVAATEPKGVENAFQHGAALERQAQFGPAHARTFAAGRNHAEDHVRVVSGTMTLRGGNCVVPRLRAAINSATMLTAISGTVCEPISK